MKQQVQRLASSVHGSELHHINDVGLNATEIDLSDSISRRVHSRLDTTIRFNEMMVITGLSRSTIFNMMNSHSKYFSAQFPIRKKLSSNPQSRAVGWSRSEVEAYLESRVKVG